ncbi:MAG: hypothetical protein AB7F86_01110 [Bdellovibrionales bacterium]
MRFTFGFLALMAIGALNPNTQALELGTIQEGRINSLPIDTSAPLLDCDQIPAALQQYNSMEREHEASVGTFFTEVENRMQEWYSVLQPYEGTAEPLPVGLFDPLSNGAGQIGMVNSMISDNSSLLAVEMDRIMESLRACTLTKK